MHRLFTYGILLTTITLGIAACGQSGKLYLPEGQHRITASPSYQPATEQGPSQS